MSLRVSDRMSKAWALLSLTSAGVKVTSIWRYHGQVTKITLNNTCVFWWGKKVTLRKKCMLGSGRWIVTHYKEQWLS